MTDTCAPGSGLSTTETVLPVVRLTISAFRSETIAEPPTASTGAIAETVVSSLPNGAASATRADGATGAPGATGSETEKE